MIEGYARCDLFSLYINIEHSWRNRSEITRFSNVTFQPTLSPFAFPRITRQKQYPREHFALIYSVLTLEIRENFWISRWTYIYETKRVRTYNTSPYTSLTSVRICWKRESNSFLLIETFSNFLHWWMTIPSISTCVNPYLLFPHCRGEHLFPRVFHFTRGIPIDHPNFRNDN